VKVLVIAPQPFFAERGTPIAVRHFVATLCADGHRVDLLTYPFGDNVEVQGLSIHRCGRFPGVRRVGIGFSLSKILLDLMLLPKLFRMAKPGRYHVVHAVEESIYLALLLRWRHKAKVVYDMDSSLVDQLADGHAAFRLLRPVLTRIERWAMRSADVVAPMCQHLADYAADARDSGEPVVLHDVPLANPPSPRLDAPPASDTSEGPPLALYVGNLEAYQGIDLLLDAAEHLPIDLPVSIRVVGGPIEEAERFQSIVEQRGLSDRIEFAGPRPLTQLHGLLAGADILLSPRTRGNNTPFKIYSYMEAGRAILATRLSTHTQVLDDSTALLVDPSPEAYARGLVRLVGDQELRTTLGKSARLRVRHSYSPRSFMRRVRDIYGSGSRRVHRTADGPGRSSESARGGESARSDESAPSEEPAPGEEPVRRGKSAWREESPPSEEPAWSGHDRRASGDRRSGGDRRSAPRAGRDRRVGDRRALAYA